MAIVRNKRGRFVKRKRRKLKGGNAGDFFAGLAAPFKSAYHLIVKRDPDAAIKDFTDLGPRLAKGFNGRGRRRMHK